MYDGSKERDKRDEFKQRLKDPHYEFRRRVNEIDEYARRLGAVSTDYETWMDEIVAYFQFRTKDAAWSASLILHDEARNVFKDTSWQVNMLQSASNPTQVLLVIDGFKS